MIGRPRKYQTEAEAREAQRLGQLRRKAGYALTGRCTNCGKVNNRPRKQCSGCARAQAKCNKAAYLFAKGSAA